MKIEIKSINWGIRQRLDYGDVTQLASNIKRLGLIHFIVLDSDKTLVAGGRRLTALILNGLEYLEENIHFRFLVSVNELEKKEIELSENIRRKDLTFDEEVLAKQALHELKLKIASEKGESWEYKDTAKELSITQNTLANELTLAKAITRHPELKECKNKSEAFTKARRLSLSVKRSHSTVDPCDDNIRLIHGDSSIELKKIAENSIDLILADPPFGVGLDKNSSFASQYSDVYGDFQDTPENIASLLDNVLPELYRVLKPGCHCYLFFSISNFTMVKQKLENSGFLFQKTPLIWNKINSHNYLPYHRFTINYEFFWFAYKHGTQKELLATSNAIFTFPVHKKEKEHIAQKPQELYDRLISLSSVEGDLILDPFLGSGISLAQAVLMGRKVIGIEKEQNYFTLSQSNITKAKGGE